jgi:hypothetical protein
MTINFCIPLVAIMLMTVTTYAQLPDAFGSEYDGITQKDELTRTYISPVKYYGPQILPENW